mmetsp:Transcript_9642/g.11118  ORF Transcript_9642/g.11118 Transcript_9642/m.11118 type:complete len:386 (-) Transcript_9642:194-1351(-)
MAEGQPHFTNTAHVTTVTRSEDVLSNSVTGQGQPTAASVSVGTPSTKPPTQDGDAHVLLSLGQDLTQFCETVSIKVPNTTSTVEVSGDISMLANEVESKTNNGLTQVRTKKRKLNNPDTNFNSEPPDFWHYLNPGEVIGDWDVLCGRGGESNNHVGNKKYRKVVDERKAAYRKIDGKQRKLKTNYVRDIVMYINECGGRFIDVNRQGRYYVVNVEKARKKTSQALRETKELKWLDIDQRKDKKDIINNKNIVCPFCKKPGHKTRIAKACLLHDEWLDANKSSILNDASTGVDVTTTSTCLLSVPTSFPGIESMNNTKLPAPVTSTNVTPTVLQPYLLNESLHNNITIPPPDNDANIATANVGPPIAEEVAYNTIQLPCPGADYVM